MPESTTPAPEPPTEAIAEAAEAALGTDPTPKDQISDEIACVSSLVAILPPEFGISRNTSYTPDLVKILKASARFKPTYEMKRGSIVVYPTEGLNVGHAMICLEDDDGTISNRNTLASNNSFGGIKGMWTRNYNRKSARAYFIANKHLKGFIFEPI